MMIPDLSFDILPLLFVRRNLHATGWMPIAGFPERNKGAPSPSTRPFFLCPENVWSDRFVFPIARIVRGHDLCPDELHGLERIEGLK